MRIISTKRKDDETKSGVYAISRHRRASSCFSLLHHLAEGSRVNLYAFRLAVCSFFIFCRFRIPPISNKKTGESSTYCSYYLLHGHSLFFHCQHKRCSHAPPIFCAYYPSAIRFLARIFPCMARCAKELSLRRSSSLSSCRYHDARTIFCQNSFTCIRINCVRLHFVCLWCKRVISAKTQETKHNYMKKEVALDTTSFFPLSIH